MPERDILVAANEAYADDFSKGDLPMPPGRQLAIVTCMDARLDPAKFLGSRGGRRPRHPQRRRASSPRTPSARSSSRTGCSGTQEVAVLAHTDCGMLTFSNGDLQAKLESEAGADASDIDFRPFSDLEESVRGSLRTIRESPLLPDGYDSSGWIYDVRSGRITEVV